MIAIARPRRPLPPMEAKLVEAIPVGDQWQYEPKWDGFRCIVFRDGNRIELQSKSCQPLQRYFPDVVDAMRHIPARQFVLDGEIIVVRNGRLSFDDLLQRIHPAASRVALLAEETPATFIAFDLLADERGRSLLHEPLQQRRKTLETFAAAFIKKRTGAVRLSPATMDIRQARRWFSTSGRALDGVIAKRIDLPYQSGERTGMQKIKRKRTADCVVAGFRYASNSRLVGSLLLGLYDADGLLHHVGFTSGIRSSERPALTRKILRHRKQVSAGGGFTGRAPGGKSRWSTERSSAWEPLDPKLVVEVEWDHFSGHRFRHGTRLLRWRPDKSPRACTLDQVSGRGASVSKIIG